MIKGYEKGATDFNQHNSSYQDVIARLCQMNTSFTADLQILNQNEVSLLFKGTDFEPDTTQCAICAYSVAQLQHAQRQMWKIPASSGKSRIIAGIALIMLKYNNKQHKRVHIVIPNKSLLKRDKTYFADYFQSMANDKVIYHKCLNFEPRKGDFVLIDETDTLIYRQPAQFLKLCDKIPMICFSATSKPQSDEQLESLVCKEMPLTGFQYRIENQLDTAQLDFHEKVVNNEQDAFIKFLLEKSKRMTVLLYTDDDTVNAVKSLGNVTVIDKNFVDHSLLKDLDTKLD